MGIYCKDKTMNKSYSKIRHIQESNLMLEQRILIEQSSSLKNQMFDLLLSVDDSDYWTDADDLMNVYKKLLPYKGKVVQPNEPFKFKIVSLGQEPTNDPQYSIIYPEDRKIFDRPMSALKFMDSISKFDLYDPKTKMKVKEANPGGNTFFDFLNNTLEKKFGLFGGEDTTSDGKFTVKQLKQMIGKLME